MTSTVRKRADGKGFEAGPLALSYRYGVSIDRVKVTYPERPYVCRAIIFDDGTRRIHRLIRVGNFYEIASGKPGDPIPTVTFTDIECPGANSAIKQLLDS